MKLLSDRNITIVKTSGDTAVSDSFDFYRMIDDVETAESISSHTITATLKDPDGVAVFSDRELTITADNRARLDYAEGDFDTLGVHKLSLIDTDTEGKVETVPYHILLSIRAT